MNNAKESPWLRLSDGYWSTLDKAKWAEDKCLREHFYLGRARRIRFVKGRTSESLRYDRNVTGHRNKRLDGFVPMIHRMQSWFGEEPVWHYVEIDTEEKEG